MERKKMSAWDKGKKLLYDFAFVSWHMIKELFRVCKAPLIVLLILVIAQAVIPYVRWHWFGRVVDDLTNKQNFKTSLIIFLTFVFIVLVLDMYIRKLSEIINQYFMESFAPYLPEARQKFGMSSFQRGSSVYNSLSEAERAEYSSRYLVVGQFQLISRLLVVGVGLSIILSFIAMLGWLIAVVTIIIIGVQVHIAVRMSHHERSLWSDKAETTNLRNQFTYKLRMKNILLFGYDYPLIERIASLSSKVTVSIRQMIYKLLPWEFLAIISLALAFAVAIWIFAETVTAGIFTTGQFAFLTTTIITLGMNIKGIVESAAQQALGTDKLVDLFRFIHGKQQTDEALGGIEDFNFRKSPKIILKKLTFEYESDKPILKDLNLFFSAGQTTYLVGANGVGKTTLFNVLSSLYPVPSDSVFVSNYDLSQINLDSIRSHIKHLGQDSLTLRLSTRHLLAIAAGLLECDDWTSEEIEEKMWAALDWACLDDKIRTFRKQLDEPMAVWRNAEEDLSGGQQRKLNIAMMFMSILCGKLSVLILDEPYQGIEPRHARVIRDKFEELNVTTIIATHYVERIPPKANVVFMMNGETEEKQTLVISGTHAEMLDKYPVYAVHCGMQN